MNGYYYVMASLPALSLQGPLPFSPASLLGKVEGFIPKKDFVLLRGVVEGRDEGCKPLRDYLERKRAVDSVLLARREKVLKGGNSQYPEPAYVDSEVIGMVEKALGEDPLDAELIISGMYWECAEKVAGARFFSFASLCVYAIKLKILSRIMRFDKRNGVEEFAKAFSLLSERTEELLRTDDGGDR